MNTPPNLQNRYGKIQSGNRRFIWWFSAGALIVFFSWVWWVMETDNTTGIEIVPVEMSSEGNSGAITFHLTAPIDTEIRCVIRSIGNDHAVNGWIVRDYPASTKSTMQYQEKIRGFSGIASIDVQKCWKLENG
jgi:hypothetical protein